VPRTDWSVTSSPPDSYDNLATRVEESFEDQRVYCIWLVR
jgi:hypothetical protein